MSKGSLRVLMLSRNYPNPIDPLLGLWVERPTTILARSAAVVVVAPVPWSPPLPRLAPFDRYTRHRLIPRRQMRHGVEIHHPRFVVGPGRRWRGQEGRAYYLGVRRLVHRLHRHFPFDVIHAEYLYPDGVAAVRLGRELGIPVVVTDHVPWGRYIDVGASIRRQAVKAAASLTAHIAVSHSVAQEIIAATGSADHVLVVPNGVDEQLFERATDEERDLDRVVFVGHLRPVKGVDVLLDAMAEVVVRRPSARLVVAGAALFPSAQRHVAELEQRALQAPLAGQVEFRGAASPTEVAELIASSAVLVLPSRSESFGSVLVEALACGVPVVATHCGGPDDIVVPDVGRLVPVEDPHALAEAILAVLDDPARYDPKRLRDYAIDNFSWASVAQRLLSIYRSAARLDDDAPATAPQDDTRTLETEHHDDRD